MRLTDIQIRDPFVLPLPDQGDYYLFGSTDPNVWSGPGIGFDCYRSTDLADWVGPIAAFRPPLDFWSPGQFWAPEVHRYGGHWYMFATFTADGTRGTQVLRSQRPQGPYVPWSNGPVTPHDWQCLDGTLYHEESAGPWIVFCHEFLQCGDGEICAAPLTADLRSIDGPVTVLFHASDAPWAKALDGFNSIALAAPPYYVTDGPFLHRLDDGTLIMLWSSFGDGGYELGIARSTTGTVVGPWQQDEKPIWRDDGGHGMIFQSFNGGLHLILHTPNQTPDERAVLIPLDASTRDR